MGHDPFPRSTSKTFRKNGISPEIKFNEFQFTLFLYLDEMQRYVVDVRKKL